MASFLTRALELPVPPAIPAGVQLERTHTESSGAGVRATVCRDAEISLLVRSLTGGAEELRGVTAWVPSTLDLPAGEVDLDSDLWWLPPEQGCHTIDIAWDPRVNVVAPPLASLEITSPFGYRRHPILGGTRLHTGTDFDADAGDPVFATSPGIVTVAGTRGGYGQMVEIEHIGALDTRYAHLSSIAVTVGAQVETGDVVGAVGCTGLCTGPHLHFETLEFGEPVDPMSYLTAPSS
jgi:murein DD-endopeptidase MepM/ murein hydrolase activator NlpD